MYTINSSSLIPVSSLWCHHTPGGFSRPATAVGRGLPYISYMLAAVVEHLSERSELCEAIANKRMYEIRKRSAFSKRSVYSP